MIFTILKSLMFWKYRWISFYGEGITLHGIVTYEKWEEIKEDLLINKYIKK